VPVSPDFVPWMMNEIKDWADRYGTDQHHAFPAWALSFVFDVEDDAAFNQTETLSQGDAGLDGWHYDRDGRVFHLAQAKLLGDPVNGIVNPGELDSLIKAALLLRDPAAIEAGPHHERLTSIALEMGQALLDDSAISLDVFLAGRISAHAEEILRASVAQLGPKYSLTVFDTARLDELKVNDEPIEDLTDEEVEFAVANNSGYFEVGELGLQGVESAAVVALDGRSLADAVDTWRARLFHANVRYYLRKSNSVNKRMLQTLDSEDGRRAFWLYNNGLTVVADSFRFLSNSGSTKLLAVNPQIVNGAQTSSVLRERRAQLRPGDVAVQCRIIAVADDVAGKEALERISEFTNSQSPVRPGDLRSNDLRHRKLQAAFRMLPSPVFYERRRGEWTALSPAAQAPFAHRRVAKEHVGQRYLAFTGSPADAISRKDAIFGELEAAAFNPDVSAHVYMLAYDLFRQADSLMKVSGSAQLLALVPGLATPMSTDVDAPTQLATLRRARALVCAHAVALVHDVLRWRYHEVSQVRAAELRSRVADPASATYRFVWRYVFRSIRLWFSSLPDKSALKATLQRPEALADIRGILSDQLVDADQAELRPI